MPQANFQRFSGTRRAIGQNNHQLMQDRETIRRELKSQNLMDPYESYQQNMSKKMRQDAILNTARSNSSSVRSGSEKRFDISGTIVIKSSRKRAEGGELKKSASMPEGNFSCNMVADPKTLRKNSYSKTSAQYGQFYASMWAAKQAEARKKA